MRRKLGALILLVVFAALPVVVSHSPQGTAQDKKIGIRFPSEVLPVPVPTPTPITSSKLTVDTLYVIEADTPVILLDSPLGLVKVTEDAGPLRVRGRFIDGDGKTETRTYKGKQVFLIEAAATGRVELLVVPIGGVAKDVLRKTVDVDAGGGPRPPPEPKPVPVNTAFPMDGKFRVLIIEETAERSKLTPGQQTAIFGVPVRNWLDSHCAIGPDGKTREYRIWDKDVDASNAPALWQRALEHGRKLGVPSIIISSGKTEYQGTLPTDDVLPLLKKMVGGE